MSRKAMCQLSLPAESLFASQALTPSRPKHTKAVAFKPSAKSVYKMQYTSIIVLGFLNAFALAVPISKSIQSSSDNIRGKKANSYSSTDQIRAPIPQGALGAIAAGIADGEAGIESGLAAVEGAIGKRSPIPSEASKSIQSPSDNIRGKKVNSHSSTDQIRSPIPQDASGAIGAGIADGEAGIESGLGAVEGAIGKRSPIPSEAAAAVANAKKTASEAIANGEKSAVAGIKSGEAAATKGEADAAMAVKSGAAAAAAGVKSGEAAESEGIATADAAIKEYVG